MRRVAADSRAGSSRRGLVLVVGLAQREPRELLRALEPEESLLGRESEPSLSLLACVSLEALASRALLLGVVHGRLPERIRAISSSASTSARSFGLATFRLSSMRSATESTGTEVPPSATKSARAYALSKSNGSSTKRSTSVAWRVRAPQREHGQAFLFDPGAPHLGVGEVEQRDCGPRSKALAGQHAQRLGRVVPLEVDHPIEIGCEARMTLEDDRDAADHEEPHPLLREAGQDREQLILHDALV